ncbi:hypothetical protein AB0D08_09985 [Kitasatospora sp. NPDC048540]|uniref:hypothetical protein n=1 Tax=unclassified Kitasatospora TaxID=2633591 RepID=UPI0011EA6554|nr:hypothetical protein [Kitasatospora sp. MBT63]
MIAGPGFWDVEIERAGWSRILSPRPADFPEIDRPSRVWGRNCYVRGADRLVIEWSDQVTISAALLNGVLCPLRSAEDLSAAIRPGGGPRR